MKDLQYDVVICGGGIAGVAAALAAARNGAKTCLLEKEYALGGLATLGLIVIYLGLDDGAGVQMSGGICEELLHLSYKYGPRYRLNDVWLTSHSPEERSECRYECEYQAAPMMIACEEALLEASVTLYYDARITDVSLKNGRLEAVILSTKEGPRAVKGRAFVDATGDADVLWMAGEDTLTDSTNVRTGWYFSTKGGELKRHGLTDPLYTPIPETSRYYNGVNLEDISQHMIDGRRMILESLKKEREEDPDWYPVLIPTFPGVRMTRRLVTDVEFSADEHDHMWFDDAIGMIGNWRKRGPRYALSYRGIKAPHLENVYAAGRCTAAEKSGWDMTRVIPSAAVTGEAAGTAAALQAKADREVEVPVLQKQLVRQGVLLDPSLFNRRYDK
ncbi:MAG: FAD-dependent oxidoreductase [Clostridia bacterium]|nr:FAD-dependent oxidoreductase [Clostridia bacterium]